MSIDSARFIFPCFELITLISAHAVYSQSRARSILQLRPRILASLPLPVTRSPRSPRSLRSPRYLRPATPRSNNFRRDRRRVLSRHEFAAGHARKRDGHVSARPDEIAIRNYRDGIEIDPVRLARFSKMLVEGSRLSNLLQRRQLAAIPIIRLRA